MKKVILVIIILLVGISLFWFFAKDRDSSNSSNRGSINNTEKINSVFVMRPQRDVDSILIDAIDMSSPGFIVIRESINGSPGQIVEVSDYLESGVNTEILIDLDQIMIDSVDFSGEFPLSTDLVAIIYEDDGDEGFNPSLDQPVYLDGQVLARYVKTGEVAPNTAVIPNTRTNESANVVVTYTNAGFSPSRIEISQGETVRFVNKSSKPMWVASDIHPAHNILPTFDQFGVSGFDESYSYTFEEIGAWKYHDHVNASMVGEIIVR